MDSYHSTPSTQHTEKYVLYEHVAARHHIIVYKMYIVSLVNKFYELERTMQSFAWLLCLFWLISFAPFRAHM